MAELWELLLSAQNEETMIPTKFLEAQMKKVIGLSFRHPATHCLDAIFSTDWFVTGRRSEGKGYRFCQPFD